MKEQNIGAIIGNNLQKIRSKRNLSLTKLAEMTGLSKVILSQIEKGDANPTINTIWKITSALSLPYSSLLEQPENPAAVVHKKDLPDLVQGRYHIFNYYPENAQHSFELYQVEMEPGCVHSSIGHAAKGKETIMVIEGEMQLEDAEETYLLQKDDAFSFDASGPHTYKNQTDACCRMVVMIDYLS
jgi:transcriptional regulator with XRE-family HTH domain